MTLEVFFRRLFAFLRQQGYSWQVVSPDRLLKLRRSAAGLDPLARYFGLGVAVAPEELLAAGLPPELLPDTLRLRPAISFLDGLFLPYTHWPEPRIYLGEESLTLLRQLEPWLADFEGRSVLDLGSGCGVLSFQLASRARKALGLELSAEAVAWARAAAAAQDLGNVRFHAARIGALGPKDEATLALGEELAGWDRAVFNPPLAVPSPSSDRPHRDGGALGIEIPLAFLDCAARHLRAGGEVFCNLTNPILLDGRGVLFERIDPRLWKIEDRRRLNDRFNQTLYRQDGYRELGIQQVELWFLRLIRR
ncbi:MAG: methyltransferase domain-containing protein [Oligoflexia bacterium]|nr:methyltransferase domain-containing protein [Oligoflexia bacterium]